MNRSNELWMSMKSKIEMMSTHIICICTKAHISPTYIIFKPRTSFIAQQTIPCTIWENSAYLQEMIVSVFVTMRYMSMNILVLNKVLMGRKEECIKYYKDKKLLNPDWVSGTQFCACQSLDGHTKIDNTSDKTPTPWKSKTLKWVCTYHYFELW